MSKKWIYPVVLVLIVIFLGVILNRERFMKSSSAEVSIRKYKELPETNAGWLTLKDHFISTVGPHSGQGEPLKNLLVIADASMAPHSRFPDHPHQDMEILTWVIAGTLQHRDNKGTDQAVPAEHLQFMSARDGIFHAEGNASDKPLRILQIWVKPQTRSGTPLVQQSGLTHAGFNLLAAPQDAPMTLRQDLWLYVAKLNSEELALDVPSSKFAYVISIGELDWNGQTLEDGDGALIGEGRLKVEGTGQAIVIIQNNN